MHPFNKHNTHSQSNQAQQQLPRKQAFNHALPEQKKVIEGGNDNDHNYNSDTDIL